MKTPKLISIGYSNIVAVDRIIAIVNPDSSPVKRTINEAKENHVLIDATCGRKTRAVLIMDTNQVVLSALNPETILNRVEQSTHYDRDRDVE